MPRRKAPLKHLVCANCGKEFSVPDNNRNANRTCCSVECARSYNGKRNKGYKHSEEECRKRSERQMGEKNHFHGKTHSKESKDKMSEYQSNKVLSEETKKKISESMMGEKNHFYGKTHTDESRRKISENHVSAKGELNPNYGNGDKIRGDKNPAWKGGGSFGEYGEEFNEELKTSVRKRDSFVCQVCGVNGFVVHHIDYDKKNNSMGNLVTLCPSCHGKTGFNREYWIEYFSNKEMLNE